jgi:hypothetical protein
LQHCSEITIYDTDRFNNARPLKLLGDFVSGGVGFARIHCAAMLFCDIRIYIPVVRCPGFCEILGKGEILPFLHMALLLHKKQKEDGFFWVLEMAKNGVQ